MILILSVMSFVFLVSQIYMFNYAQNSTNLTRIFNETLNTTFIMRTNLTACFQANLNIVLAQDMIFMIMRILLPFIVMVICNVILVNYISNRRKIIIRERKAKKEYSFTIAVLIMNASFLFCNISVVIYYIMAYYLKFSGASLPLVSVYINSLFGTCAILFSYMFTLSEFFIDLIFNKVFRKRILWLILNITTLGATFKTSVRTNRRNIQESHL